ncbi:MULTISPECIES: AraC family transcriptional regulator [unclassified Brenneria]|uniref:helix-turn-helix transcriptional regulator n=1 Tax=unclassified Brenneria TaxID=2634434 RepID=UPI0029C4634B|nr:MULTISPECIES: AraC family transcriptional regulator [unclassified Brenneria]MDX5627049.1 AraC family transcriptional regulator [Brenneria sp. L3-3Z]MDX5693601.1 AraC family transcriptional regulator [Brenneria sp. L4-2C]
MQAEDDDVSRLSLQTICSRQAHDLHRVKLLMPALCRVNSGKKRVQWGEHGETADRTQLILFPAGYDLHLANYPDNGRYLSQILYIPPSLIHRFRQHHPAPLARDKKPTFCLALDHELLYCWQQLTDAFEKKFSRPLLEHATLGMLLMLQNRGAAEILLTQRDDSLVNRCQRLLMLDPSTPWTASLVATHLHMATSTFHRRLAAEGGSFQEILDDVRLGNALTALQTTQKPVGQIAIENGYQCPSRFTARFQKRFQITPRALRQAIKSAGVVNDGRD